MFTYVYMGAKDCVACSGQRTTSCVNLQAPSSFLLACLFAFKTRFLNGLKLKAGEADWPVNPKDPPGCTFSTMELQACTTMLTFLHEFKRSSPGPCKDFTDYIFSPSPMYAFQIKSICSKITSGKKKL